MKSLPEKKKTIRASGDMLGTLLDGRRQRLRVECEFAQAVAHEDAAVVHIGRLGERALPIVHAPGIERPCEPGLARNCGDCRIGVDGRNRPQCARRPWRRIEARQELDSRQRYDGQNGAVRDGKPAFARFRYPRSLSE